MFNSGAARWGQVVGARFGRVVKITDGLVVARFDPAAPLKQGLGLSGSFRGHCGAEEVLVGVARLRSQVGCPTTSSRPKEEESKWPILRDTSARTVIKMTHRMRTYKEPEVIRAALFQHPFGNGQPGPVEVVVRFVARAGWWALVIVGLMRGAGARLPHCANQPGACAFPRGTAAGMNGPRAHFRAFLARNDRNPEANCTKLSQKRRSVFGASLRPPGDPTIFFKLLA